MKIKLFVFAILIMFTSATYAQTPYPGNDSDRGVTMCGFPNCYTGNLSFYTKDLVVSGAIGKRGLSWKRRANSRTSQAEYYFGLGHNWTHNWQWEMADEGKDSQGRSVISVHQPSGIVHRFTEFDPGEWWSTPNVRDRVISDKDVFTLQKRGGVEIRFTRDRTPQGDSFTLNELTDGQGNVWKLTYSSGRLKKITEPAGRWLNVHYKNLHVPGAKNNTPPFRVISHVTASDGQKVVYKYKFPRSVDYPVLTDVIYPDKNRAVYTYTAPRAGTRLLLIQADDPRGDNRLRGRRFSYCSEVDAPAGQILDIRAIGNGAVMCELSADEYDLRSYAVKQTNGSTVYRTYTPEGKVDEIIDALGYSKTFEYGDDGRGLLIAATDELGHVTRHEYNAVGDRTKTIYPDNTMRSWQYDAKGRLLVKTDEQGNSYTLTRDAAGRVIKVMYPDGGTDEMTYNDFGQMLTRKDRSGNVTTFALDERGLRKSTTDPLGNITRMTHDAHDRIASVIDPLGNITRFERDKAGRPIKVVYADNTGKSMFYDRFGKLIKRIDPMGGVRSTTYDKFGRTVSRHDAEGHETCYEYAPISENGASLNKAVKSILPKGRSVVTTFDANGRATAVTKADGTPGATTTRYGYDAKGRKTSVTRPSGETVKLFYDERDRITTVMSTLGFSTTYTYNPAGRKLSETDAKGNTTYWAYDEAGRQVTKTDAEGQVTRRTYYPSGRLASLVDAKGNTFRYEYDALGRQTALVYPDGSKEYTTYNAAGKKTAYNNRAGITCTYAYDNRWRELLSEWSDESKRIVKGYDAANRITFLYNGVSKLTFTYDKNGRILSETQDISSVVTGGTFDPEPRTIRYTYTDDGKRESVTYPDGSNVVLTYTSQNQLEDILAEGTPPPIAGYEYDEAGNAARMPRKNLTESMREYDAENKVTQIVEHDSNRNPLSVLDYVYDEAGNPVSTTATIESEVAQNLYQYDATHQLTSVDSIQENAKKSGISARDVSYMYDEVGNRIEVYDDGEVTSYSVNTLNEYEQVGNSTPTYDRNGNLTELDDWHYCYDASNRLVEASNGIVTAKFYYDAKNRVVARNYNGYITFNTYDKWNLIEEHDESGRQKARYIYGRKIDEIVAMVNRHGIFFPHHDALGNVTMLTDINGRLVERYIYTESGEVQILDASGAAMDVSAVDNRWMFTGREWLPEIKLYDYRNRVYSAKLGRFLQTDPMRFNAGDINLYRYVLNNPVRFTDPNGLDLLIYSSDAFGIDGINHAFAYSTVENDGVGRSGSSGTPGSHDDPGYPEDFDPNVAPYNTWDYNVVYDLNGYTEAQVINSIRNDPTLNDGLWVPYINDCHTDLDDSFSNLGITYPGAPNDRVDLDNWFIDSLNNASDWIYDVFDSWLE